MSEHIIAISTYGSNRIRHPSTKQTISAYKLGYTSVARDMLLALLQNQVEDVTSRHASYHYVQIKTDVTVRQGYILLKVTDDELKRAEAVTLQAHRPGVYRWMDGGWSEFPKLGQPDYVPVTDRYFAPHFNPTSLLIASTAGKKEAAVSGITTEKTQRSAQDIPWHWIRGDTYPHREILKRWGCRWSKRQRAWYFIGADLPDAVQQLIKQSNTPDENLYQQNVSESDHAPCSDEEAAALLGVAIQPQIASPTPEEPPDDEPRIRIIKPILDTAEPDAIVDAIQQTKANDLPIFQRSKSTRHGLIPIPQSPCGELTGSITGSIWCYGYAVHEEVCVYLNCGGPRMAVEAIRAKLAKGDMVSLIPDNAPSIELTAGEGNTGTYSAFLQNIPEAKFTSLILCHEMLIHPNYGGASTTYLFHITDEQAMAQLRHHITKLVKVPVFPDWTGYLWQAGQSAMLVRPTRTGGNVRLWTISLDVDAWTRLITGGLSQRII